MPQTTQRWLLSASGLNAQQAAASQPKSSVTESRMSAKAIADSLKDADLYSGRRPSAIDAGHELYLTIKIKFCKPEAASKPKHLSDLSGITREEPSRVLLRL